MAKKNACYQCEKRSAECHATCEEYQEYFRKREEYRRKMFEKKNTAPTKDEQSRYFERFEVL